MKPKVFIASPLFNPAQHAVLDRLETALAARGFRFYSARHHSGSKGMTAEQRQSHEGWIPVFESNVEGLDECDVCIANIGYQMPDSDHLALISDYGRAVLKDLLSDLGSAGSSAVPMAPVKAILELPDAGTVWEMGYMRGQNKMVIGFHPESQPKKLNLMLSHGCDGIITGWDNLERFLNETGNSVCEAYAPCLLRHSRFLYEKGEQDAHDDLLHKAGYFNWTAVHQFDAQTKEVE